MCKNIQICKRVYELSTIRCLFWMTILNDQSYFILFFFFCKDTCVKKSCSFIRAIAHTPIICMLLSRLHDTDLQESWQMWRVHLPVLAFLLLLSPGPCQAELEQGVFDTLGTVCILYMAD